MHRILPFSLLAAWTLGALLWLAMNPSWLQSQEKPAASAVGSVSPRPSGPKPDESLGKLVTQPEIRLELAACEPTVIDPVAIRFDAQGRMWVVEMRDYPLPIPNQRPNGRIRVLQDTDQDGIYETATTFADQLLFPTGLQPWKQGVIVTLAGKICFFADDDGDLRSDRQETWFSGFAEENEQLRANHPTLGPDGLVYVAGGLRGGTIESQDKRWSQEQPLKLTGVDFAFDPQGGFFGPVTGNSQFGLTIDDFGNRLGCSNRNPAIQAVLPWALVNGSSTLTPRDALHDAALVGPQSEVRPIAQAWTTSNLHAGQFSAACGVLRGCGPGMPAEWAHDLFVCEPTAYLVQRQTTSIEAPALLQARRPDGPECVASGDEWFRPVDLAHGPDGCLYIVDMMRAVIEHPDWMPEELKARADMRWGSSKGRIWRLTDRKQKSTTSPTDNNPSDPTAWLSHPNPWHRAVASQQLHEQSVTPALIARVQSVSSAPDSTAEGVARAAQFLHKHAPFDASLVDRLLSSPDARLRRLAVGLWWEDISLDQCDQLAGDLDAGVRFQVALALALKTDSSRVPTLAALVRSDGENPWFIRVVSSVAPKQAAEVLLDLVKAEPIELPASSWTTLSSRAGQSDPNSFDPVLCHVDSDAMRLLAIVKGWTRGSAGLSPPARETLLLATRRAAELAVDPAQSLGLRQLAVEIVGRDPSRVSSLRGLVDAAEPAALRGDALRLLLRYDRRWALEWLDDSLTSLPPSIRQTAITALLSDAETVHWLLDRIERQAIALPLVGLSNIDRLKRSGDAKIRDRAVKVFQATSKDRSQIITRYAEALSGAGKATHGAALFRQHCAACHRIDEVGTDVGPDISDSRTKTMAALLTSVLDPNAGIDAAYLRYTVLTLDGTVYDGLLLSDSAGTVVLQIQGGERLRLAHEDIESISTSGVSLMPEGFEQLISVDEMRDLLSYVKNWRYLNGAIPLAE